MAMSRSALAERAVSDIRAVAARRERAEMGAASTRPAGSGRPPVAAARAAFACGTLAGCPCGWSPKYLCETPCAEQRRRDEQPVPHLPHKSPAVNLYGQAFRRVVNHAAYVDLFDHHRVLAFVLPPLLLSWKAGLCLIGVGCQEFRKSLFQYMR